MKKKEMKRKNKAMKKDLELLYNEFVNLCVSTQEIIDAYESLEEKYNTLELKCVHLVSENEALKNYTKTTNHNDNIAIENVDWDGDTTTVTWSDGTTTTVKRQKGEKYDRQSAISYAITKKVLGNTSIAEVVESYDESHKNDAKYARIYRALRSKSARNRIRAQKAWEKVPENKKASIKARIANESK